VEEEHTFAGWRNPIMLCVLRDMDVMKAYNGQKIGIGGQNEDVIN